MAHDLGRCILVVAAHPDDEALGCGATLARAARKGAAVHIAFLADGVGAREPTAAGVGRELGARRAAAEQAARILGARSAEHFDFPDNGLDTVPLLEVARVVEGLVAKYSPDTVFTHHAGDLNVDHRRAFQAVATACRPQPGYPVERILCFEVPSSTEWQPPGAGAIAFSPQLFVDVTQEMGTKRLALEAYAAEMRPWPHPRSYEAVEHLAHWRGASVGCEAAEAFVVARLLVRSS
jgi:N-acetylglucosamine malate deacetylase 1